MHVAFSSSENLCSPKVLLHIRSYSVLNLANMIGDDLME